MRSNLFLLTCLLLLCFTSCQKSIEWNDVVLTPPTPVTPTTPGGGTTITSLLSKMVVLSTSDTLTYNYTYDAAKRLIKITTIGSSSGSKVDDIEILLRDATGKLIQYNKIAYSSTSTNVNGYDTTYTKLHYPANSSNFDYTVSNTQISGFFLSDSIAYTHVNNKVSQSKSYYSNTLTFGQYILAFGSSYTYDSKGNLLTLKSYDYVTPTTPKLNSELSYTFDSKKCPLMLGNEAIIMNADQSFIGSNNGLTAAYKDYSSTQSVTVDINYTYSYNTNGYPTQAIGTGTSSTSSVPNKLLAFYFYQ